MRLAELLQLAGAILLFVLMGIVFIAQCIKCASLAGVVMFGVTWFITAGLVSIAWAEFKQAQED